MNGTYFAEPTERLVRQRKLNDKRKRKMDNPKIYNYVLAKLKNKLAPHIIQHDIERDVGLSIGKDAIYEYTQVLSKMDIAIYYKKKAMF